MKKIFLLAVLLLAACSTPTPQATFTPQPTATLTPAPTITPTATISPVITEKQAEIAGITQNLTLNTEGKLEYKGVTYDGLTYGEDGNWHLTLADGTEVTLAPGQMSMDDEYGFSANGYAYDKTKGWTKNNIANTEMGMVAISLFEQLDYDLDAVELKMDKGVVVGIEKETGEEIFRDGKFDVFWLREALVASGDLMPTKYAPAPGNVLPGTPVDNDRPKIYGPQIEAFSKYYLEKDGIDPHRDENGKYRGSGELLLDPSINAWGLVPNVDFGDGLEQVLIYQTKDGIIEWVKVKRVSENELAYFWRDGHK